ncbi:hypothetical protein C8A01DRAFT_41556 [Parachaetomium inaequale]|uniref:Mediator of RNA polymerase II transcription subunit 22 n=1 Tax=Parachaetomium inaequale TaxID=2588326 RepID=A0AAN6P756_9PEZI|nr:hypothetical protein C8A01DRAFT_41556 [Parachaetomium inaequale]
MDRDATAANNLLERKNILIADIVTSVRDLFSLAIAPVDNTASTGQTAESSMAMETKMSAITKSTEDLVTLSRKIRELWIAGALRAAGADAEPMDPEPGQVFSLLTAIRERQRQGMLQRAAAAGGGFTYEVGGTDGPAPQLQPPEPQVDVTAEGGGVKLE